MWQVRGEKAFAAFLSPWPQVDKAWAAYRGSPSTWGTWESLSHLRPAAGAAFTVITGVCGGWR